MDFIIDSTILQSLLLSVIFLAILVEIKTGGTGIGALLGIIAAGVFGVKYLNKDTDKSSDNVITIAHKYGETKVNKNPSNILYGYKQV